LLDVPRLRGVPWLEPGEDVYIEDLEAAEQAQGVTVGPGDILLVRTGHSQRLAELDPWNTAAAKTGLLKGLLLGLLAFKKALIAGGVAVVAFLKRVLGGRQTDQRNA